MFENVIFLYSLSGVVTKKIGPIFRSFGFQAELSVNKTKRDKCRFPKKHLSLTVRNPLANIPRLVCCHLSSI